MNKGTDCTVAQPWQRNRRLAAVVQSLFPGTDSVHTPRRGTGRQPGTTDYVLIPSVDNVKLMLPTDPTAVTAAGIRNYRPYSSRRDKMKRQAIAVAMAAGLGARMCDRLRVDNSSATVTSHLNDVLGRDVLIGLHMGPARAVEKPVLQVMNPTGTTLAFAKLGDSNFSRNLVRSEADAISFLNDLNLTALRVPQMLHQGTWNGNEILVQEALHGSSISDLSEPRFIQAMIEVARCQPTMHPPLADSPYLAGLHRHIAHLDQTADVERIELALRSLERAHSATAVELGASHGDWAPWNMSTNGDQALVWDWEMFRTGVPVGFDAIHFDVQESVVRRSTPPREALASVMSKSSALLAPFGISRSAGQLTVRLYAIDLAVRYLADGELEAGATPMTRLSNWLPFVLGSVENAGA